MPHKARITPENWLELDELSQMWELHNTETGEQRLGRPDDWITIASEIELGAVVPERIRKSFEAVRAVIAYGCFYYPLFNLALSEVYRLAEVALAFAYDQAKGPRAKKSMEKRIEWLAEHGILSQDVAAQWHELRKSRNSWAHDASRLLPPMWPIAEMDRVCERISTLFEATDAFATKNGA